MYVPPLTAHNDMNKRTFDHQAGFSLLEIAIVLVILGIVLGGVLAPLSAQYENSRTSDTSLALDEIREAIYGYAMVNGRLACPDTSGDGMENVVGPNCASMVGGIPWATLAIAQTDAWGQAFLYRITANFSDSVAGTGCGIATPGVSFELCSTGDITVRDSAGGNVVALSIPAVVFSGGKNWAVSTSPDELENSDGDAVFVSKIYSNISGSEFDDLIVWVTPAILKTRMVKAGRLP